MAVRLSGIHLVVSRGAYLYQWLLLFLDWKPPHAPTAYLMLSCSQGCLYLEYTHPVAALNSHYSPGSRRHTAGRSPP